MSSVKIETPVVSISFWAHFTPPKPVRSGFAESLKVELSDFGNVPDGEDSYSLRIVFRGRKKNSAGKPDMRTRDTGWLSTGPIEDRETVIAILEGATDANLIRIAEVCKQELTLNRERWSTTEF